MMKLKYLDAVTAPLSANGAVGYVTVADGTVFSEGQVISLTSTGPSAGPLQISQIKGVAGSVGAKLYLIDIVSQIAYNASAFTTALTSVVSGAAQTLWMFAGEDDTAPTNIFCDSQMQTLLARVLPGGVTAASNVAVTNWPASQLVSMLTAPLAANAATETGLQSIIAKLNATIGVTQSTSPWVISGSVSGSKTNNAAVPGATNLGVLPAIANAASPTWIEGNQTGLSVDLDGNLRTITRGLGTAGAPAGGVLSIQGVPGGTPVPTSSAVSGPQTVTWDAATLVDTTLPISTEGFTTVGMQYAKTGVITAGAFVIEISNDGTTWNIVNPGTMVGSTVISPYQLSLGSVALQAFISGFRYSRIRLSTAIVGAGTADFSIMASQGGVKADVVSSSAASVPQVAVWDATTLVNATLEIDVDRFTTVGVQYEKIGAIAGGVITFEVSSNSVWTPIAVGAASGTATATTASLTGVSDGWQAFVSGFLKFRIRLSTVITGAGSASFYMMASQAGVKPGPSTLGVIVLSGALTANQGNVGTDGAWKMCGDKSTNAAAPGATNIGALVGIANAAAPTLVETRLCGLSMDLAGNLRSLTVGGKTNNAAIPGATNIGALTAIANAAAPVFTETYQTGLSVDLAGNLRSIITGLGTSGTAVGGVVSIQGTKVHNAAIPSTNLGTLPAVANAALPTWTETYQTGLSVDLKGRLRVRTADPRVVGDGVTVVALTDDTILIAVAAGQIYRVTASNDTYWHANSACTIGAGGNANFIPAKSPEEICFSASAVNVYFKVVAGTSTVTISTLV